MNFVGLERNLLFALRVMALPDHEYIYRGMIDTIDRDGATALGRGIILLSIPLASMAAVLQMPQLYVVFPWWLGLPYTIFV
jgi:hypothetical protein